MYLLDLEQEDDDGRAKAKFFASLGFSADDPAKFAESIKAHRMTARLKNTLNTEYGEKFVFICGINAPSGKDICITSIWQIDNGQRVARLITAYPAR